MAPEKGGGNNNRMLFGNTSRKQGKLRPPQ
jgi:hypothetical protein